MHYDIYIEQALYKFDKVLLILNEYRFAFEQIDIKCIDRAKLNILILSQENWDFTWEHISFKRISAKSALELSLLYYTYEFSNNFIVLKQGTVFASIFNYVQTKILTLEEAWQILLEK